MNDTNTTYDTAVRDADFDDFADSATAVTSDASDADEIATTLAQWWQTNARDLPWRFGRTTPWGVLVSEVMSQQTQMGRVVPYWTAWMDRWPDAAALADAPKSDVITAWGRLGYPRRALRLQECAHVIAYDYADELPHTYDELLALPGIGDYTASAVLSFAFGERIAVVDTNIRRVLSRAFVGVESLGGSASPAERALAKRLLPDDDSAKCRRFDRPSVVWNQAVMELGATVCTAKSPFSRVFHRFRQTVSVINLEGNSYGECYPTHSCPNAVSPELASAETPENRSYRDIARRQNNQRRFGIVAAFSHRERG